MIPKTTQRTPSRRRVGERKNVLMFKKVSRKSGKFVKRNVRRNETVLFVSLFRLKIRGRIILVLGKIRGRASKPNFPAQFYSFVSKPFKNPRWRAREARLFALFCAALQNIDFGIKTETSKTNHRLQKNTPDFQNAKTYPYPRNLAKLRPSKIRPVLRIST